MIKVKGGVVFGGFAPALVRILLGLVKLSERWEIVITAASDGQHLGTSRHYSYEAVDFRTKQYPQPQKGELIEAVRAQLGEDFTVLLEGEGTENEHGHAQPRKGTRYGVEKL